VRAFASTDPDRAEQLAASITVEGLRRSIFVELARTAEPSRRPRLLATALGSGTHAPFDHELNKTLRDIDPPALATLVDSVLTEPGAPASGSRGKGVQAVGHQRP
jgi:hypothetical protein